MPSFIQSKIIQRNVSIETSAIDHFTPVDYETVKSRHWLLRRFISLPTSWKYFVVACVVFVSIICFFLIYELIHNFEYPRCWVALLCGLFFLMGGLRNIFFIPRKDGYKDMSLFSFHWVILSLCFPLYLSKLQISPSLDDKKEETDGIITTEIRGIIYCIIGIILSLMSIIIIILGIQQSIPVLVVLLVSTPFSIIGCVVIGCYNRNSSRNYCLRLVYPLPKEEIDFLFEQDAQRGYRGISNIYSDDEDYNDKLDHLYDEYPNNMLDEEDIINQVYETGDNSWFEFPSF